MSLPSFPDFDKKPNKPSVKPPREPQDNFGSLPSLELPDLDSLLDDEYSISDEYQSSQEDFYVDPEDSPEEEEYEEDTGFTTIDTEEEVYDFEDREDSPDGFDEEFSLEEDSEEDSDDGGFVIEDEDEGEDEYEEEEFEELELPPEAYESFSVLPNVMPEEDEEDLGFELMTEEVEEEKREVEKPKLKKEKKPQKSKGFKEMDDESVKEFFLDIKDRILGIIPSVGRKQPSKPKQKIRKPKNKLRSIISGVIMLALIAGIGLTFVSNLGFKTLEESVITIKADELSLEFSEFRESEGKLVFTAKNKANISADFIINVSVKTKSLMPFMGKEMKGVSDIIALEPDMSSEQFVSLEDLNAESKYKIKFDIVQLP